MTAAVTPGRHDFPVVAARDIYVGKVLALRADEVQMPGGRTGVREILEHTGAVAVAAVDDDQRIMLIHQYRHAVRRRLWELPAGLLDVDGEDPLTTAQRELAEEAGLRASDWSLLLDIVPSPGFSEESVRIYLARGITEMGRPVSDADDEESDLVTRWVPLADALRMVFSGEIVNATTVSAVLALHALATQKGNTRPVDTDWVDRPTRFAARQR